MSPAATVMLPLAVVKAGRKIKREMAAEALEQVGLLDKERAMPITLSGGEQQMLAIGRALMAQPKLLLLDEPLLGLSPLIQAVLVRATKEIRDEMGISIIVTEQYARPVLPIVDYAFILENGAAWRGSHADLRFKIHHLCQSVSAQRPGDKVHHSTSQGQEAY